MDPDVGVEHDVVGVGNAMVDVIGTVAEEMVGQEGLTKGAMHLIDEERAHYLYEILQETATDAHGGRELVEASGGSAANTMAGIASFGGSSGYIGKVRGDYLGQVFVDDMRSLGVAFDVPPATDGPATGRCLILVTPDAQRTLSTYLGVSTLLEPADVHPEVATAGKILFCEGYLWDTASAKAGIRKAMDLARDAGRKVSLTLSDPFCVERHHQDLQVELACVTRGAKGSWLVTADDVVEIQAEEIAPVIDTTGAGDQYAAGVLFGLCRDLSLPVVGRLGSLAAAEVISHLGPRPERPLSDFLDEV